MNITEIWIIISTIVFTLAAFSYPPTAPYSYGFRGFAVILAIVGWILIIKDFIR